LPPGYCAIAQDADALVVKRMPFPAQIGGLEEREFFFWEKARSHISESAELNWILVLFKIGNRADVHIGQTPSARGSFERASSRFAGKILIRISPTGR
jgi:hypothetical protein